MCNKVCLECEKKIDLSSDKYVLLGTYSGNNIDDESFFHFKCFKKWYNKRVSEKAKNEERLAYVNEFLKKIEEDENLRKEYEKMKMFMDIRSHLSSIKKIIEDVENDNK